MQAGASYTAMRPPAKAPVRSPYTKAPAVCPGWPQTAQETAQTAQTAAQAALTAAQAAQDAAQAAQDAARAAKVAAQEAVQAVQRGQRKKQSRQPGAVRPYGRSRRGHR